MTTTREELRELLDAVPDDRLDAARLALYALTIPDDDEPYTDEDLAAVAETRAELATGHTIDHDAAMRSIGLA